MTDTALSRSTASYSDKLAASFPIAAAPALGRLLLAGLFLISGVGKIAAPAMTIGYIQSVGLPFPEVAYAGAIFAEIVGGLALVLGFQTRLVALALAGFSIATAVTFHNALGDQNQFIHFLKNVSIAGGLLQVVAFGGGRFSLDALRAR
ncbi:DoxX family protein [Caulobacter sp. CCNWLY153]|uniref:LysR family transcriptional regulator n=1 Tax=Caulobacter radicis TaxID=2172650 RepID=A0A2T9IYT0_9CAUL|nr:DoxX family protein [Caulobacter radicis]PVM72358.1 LysR family transcriptional regulator [Caulobacter radicis]